MCFLFSQFVGGNSSLHQFYFPLQWNLFKAYNFRGISKDISDESFTLRVNKWKEIGFLNYYGLGWNLFLHFTFLSTLDFRDLVLIILRLLKLVVKFFVDNGRVWIYLLYESWLVIMIFKDHIEFEFKTIIFSCCSINSYALDRSRSFVDFKFKTVHWLCHFKSNHEFIFECKIMW